MFANQNSVCRLANAYTLDKLTQHFDLDDMPITPNDNAVGP